MISARPELLDAILMIESGRNPNARSRKGARGLMQLMPGTAIEMGLMPDKIDDPFLNAQAGARYFDKMLKRYKGDEWKALIAYNAGPGAMDAWRIPPESLKYAANVLRRAPREQKPLINRALGAAGSALSGLIGEGTAEAMWPFSSPPPKSEVPLMRSPTFGPSFPPAKATGPGATLEIPSLPRPNPASTPTRPENVAPAGDTGGIIGLPPGVRVAPSGGSGASGLPAPSNQTGGIVGLPPGVKISAGSPSARLSISGPPQESAAERKDIANTLIAIDELNTFVTLADKVNAKNLSSAGQQALFQHPLMTEPFGGTPDPDAEALFNSAGRVRANVAKGYLGGRIGSRILEMIGPHIPNPPQTGGYMPSDILPSGDSFRQLSQKGSDLKKDMPRILTIRKLMVQNPAAAEAFVNAGMPPEPSAAPTPTRKALPPDAVKVLN